MIYCITQGTQKYKHTGKRMAPQDLRTFQGLVPAQCPTNVSFTTSTIGVNLREPRFCIHWQLLGYSTLITHSGKKTMLILYSFENFFSQNAVST